MTGQLSIEGVPPRDPSKSQYFTHPDLAWRLVEWCAESWPDMRRGWHVLEPSAGAGAFVKPALAYGCNVTAFEIDEGWAGHIALNYPEADVRCEDYMATGLPEEPFDLALINPPYEDGQDGDFMENALRDSQRMCALIRTQALHGDARYRQVWGRRDVALVGIRFFINRPFPGQYEYCAVKLAKKVEPEARRSVVPDIGWWFVRGGNE